ncbi:hypothetical protein [Campylobacter sp.]|nr:hypothetical protein [Campylobacter sp.]MDO4674444.1 hypothetical protein [Campylobacter sp.]
MQNHLGREATINLGSFYTPDFLVDEVYGLLEKWVGDLGTYVFG